MSKLQDEQNVRALFLQCAWLERSGLTAAGRAEVEGLLQPKIRYLLQVLAKKLAARPPAGRWIAEAAAPGYLLRAGAGLKVHVPVHLFDDVPYDEVLDELLRLGATIRTGGGALCLSGSSAVYGALEHIGDCDFCEYLDGDAADDLRYAADRVCAVSAGDLQEIVRLFPKKQHASEGKRALDSFDRVLVRIVPDRETNVLLRAAAAARAEYARDLRTNYGEVPDDVCDRAAATAAVLFGQCVTDRAGESLSPDAMLAALEALPDEAGAAVSTLLERFVEDVDAQIAQAVH